MSKREASRMAGGLDILLVFFNFLLYLVIRDLNYGDSIPEIFLTRGLPILAAGLLLPVLVRFIYYLLEDSVPDIKALMMWVLLLVAVVILDQKYWDVIPDIFSENRNRWELHALGVTGFYVGEIVRTLDKEFTTENNLLSCLCIMVWTIVGGIFTSNLPMSYAVSMAVTNSVIVAAAFFVVSPERKRYGNRLVYALLYAGINVVHVLMNSDAIEWFVEFLYDASGWRSVQNNIFLLFEKAKMIGPAYEGITRVSKELLADDGNSILSIAYYFGLGPMTVYLFLLVVLLVIFAVAVYKSREEKSFFILTVSAYTNLVVRLVFGMLYSFGISPLHILPPFTGENGYFSDMCCAFVLLFAYYRWMKKAGYTGGIAIKDSVVNLLIKLFTLDDDEEWKDEEDDEN